MKTFIFKDKHGFGLFTPLVLIISTDEIMAWQTLEEKFKKPMGKLKSEYDILEFSEEDKIYYIRP